MLSLIRIIVLLCLTFVSYGMEVNDSSNSVEESKNFFEQIYKHMPELADSILNYLSVDDLGYNSLKLCCKSEMTNEQAQRIIKSLYYKLIKTAVNYDTFKLSLDQKNKQLTDAFPNYNALSKACQELIIAKLNMLENESTQLALELNGAITQVNWLQFDNLLKEFLNLKKDIWSKVNKINRLRILSETYLVIQKVKKNLSKEIFSKILKIMRATINLERYISSVGFLAMMSAVIIFHVYPNIEQALPTIGILICLPIILGVFSIVNDSFNILHDQTTEKLDYTLSDIAIKRIRSRSRSLQTLRYF